MSQSKLFTCIYSMTYQNQNHHKRKNKTIYSTTIKTKFWETKFVKDNNLIRRKFYFPLSITSNTNTQQQQQQQKGQIWQTN